MSITASAYAFLMSSQWVPRAPARVPGHAIGHEVNDELHQRLAVRHPARIETGLVDGADHRPARQKPGARAREGLGEVVERRTADMDVACLIGRGTGAIRHRTIEREVDAEEGLPPIVALDLAGNCLADLRFAQEIESEVAGIDIGGEHAVKRDDLAVVEPDRNSPALLHGDALHA